MDNLPREKTDVERFCDNVKLSDFNQIQSYGVLLVLDNNLRILQGSENVAILLETSIEEILNQPISHFLITENTVDDIPTWFHQTKSKYNRMLWQAKEKQLPIFVTISRYSGQILLEIERDMLSDSITQADLTKYMIAKTRETNIEIIHEIYQIAAEEIKTITGYHRVIIYKFDREDQSGVVVGQALDDDMDSYFGLTFPASDIPAPVRMAYLIQPLRYIPDMYSENIKIVPEINSATNNDLDLSYINLRMVSPVHAQYTYNMGVQATCCIALILENKLWGLILCHHKEAKYLSTNDRTILLYIAKNLSLRLFAMEKDKELSEELKASELEATLNSYIGKEDSLDSIIEKYHIDFMQLVSATGMSVCFPNKITNYGNTPSNQQILDLVKWLKESNYPDTYATSRLPSEYPPSLTYKNIACGVLRTKMIAMGDAYLMFYRPERVETISWAGNPDERIIFFQSEYSPRNTFARFQQYIANTSIIWTEREIKSAHFIQSVLTKQQLQDLLNQQVQADKLATVNTLAAGVAHEINNPLSYVISNMNFFGKRMATFQKMLRLFESLADHLNSGQTEKNQKAIDEIMSFSKANNMNEKFSDLTDLIAESSAGLLEIKSIVNDMKSLITQPNENEKMIDINACVKFAITTVMEQTKAKFTLHQHYTDLLEVNGNRLQLQTVFTHLLKNAVQAIDDNGEISISTAVENGDIVITFTDNGCGIEAENLKNLFTPFFTRKPVGTGRGLGLSLVYNIVKLHGGTITVKSEPGAGSVFVVRLPTAR